jgi:hypothetical protein
MRVLIAGPAKTGNEWSKCMIGSIYGLRPLDGTRIPEGAKLVDLRRWIRAGGFPDNSIFHQHFRYSNELADLVESVPAHLVTVVRDPYDTFVSTYFSVQRREGNIANRSRQMYAILDKPLDSPEIYNYLRSGGFRQSMLRAREWIQSGRSIILRYEALHADPVAELSRLTNAIQPVPEERILRAIDGCSAENMRKQGPKIAAHVRVAKVGDSRERLTEEHLAIFRDLHADVIREMGYEVR